MRLRRSSERIGTVTQILPEQWKQVDQELVTEALRVVRAVLDDRDVVISRVAAYYRQHGDYAGATFLDLNPNNPYSFEASDLLAITLLNVDVPAMAARRILQPGPTSAQLSRLLAHESLPIDSDLRDATIGTWTVMGDLYEAAKAALAPHHVRSSDRWVTASKLCARKRPELFPVRDDDVTTLLGTRGLKSYAADWQVFQHLLRDDDIMARLDDVVDGAAAEDDVRTGNPNLRLRHLDVALWTHVNPPPGTR
jgi:Family of unknown function (DUF6308)